MLKSLALAFELDFFCMRIKELRDFVLSLSQDERRNFADKCGTTTGMLLQIYCGNRKCNPTLAIEIDKHSGGLVKCDVLCPDVDFDYLRQQATPQNKTPDA